MTLDAEGRKTKLCDPKNPYSGKSVNSNQSGRKETKMRSDDKR